MKKTVIKDEVVIRSGEAERDGKRNEKGVIYKGFEIEVIDTVTGEEIDGNDVWYKDKNGDYYWSGGFVEHSLASGSIRSLAFNYNQELDFLTQSEKDAKGAGINVCIIDSGINADHLAFNSEIKDTFNAINQSEQVYDDLGHGTHVAGIIGARNYGLDNSIIGIAPKTNLFVAKVSNSRIIYPDEFVKALKWAQEIEAKIINVSLSLQGITATNASEFDDLIGILNELIETKTIIVAAAGKNKRLIKGNEMYIYFPAWYNQCISVGTIENSFFKENPNLEFSDKIDFILPNLDVYSSTLKKNGFGLKKGSSMAAATISGIFALKLSLGKTPQEIFEDFNQLPKLRPTNFESNPFKVYTP